MTTRETTQVSHQIVEGKRLTMVSAACLAARLGPHLIDRQGRTAPGERLTEAINTVTDAYMRLLAGTHAYAREAD